MSAERQLASPRVRTGAAFHSLRAVPLETLREAVARPPSHRCGHCRAHSHRRAAEGSRGLPREHRPAPDRAVARDGRSSMSAGAWCTQRMRRLPSSRVSRRRVPRSASRSAPRPTWATASSMPPASSNSSGRLCVGSDSQATVCPAEELRWLEYQARLRKRRRGVLADSQRAACRHAPVARGCASRGARPWDNPPAPLRPAARAIGWCSIPSTPAWPAQAQSTALDHLIFAGGSAAIRDVMVGGPLGGEGSAACGRGATRGTFQGVDGATGPRTRLTTVRGEPARGAVDCTCLYRLGLPP